MHSTEAHENRIEAQESRAEAQASRTEIHRLEARGWHLDKKVPISMIAAILALALSGFWGFADLKKDVELLKANAVVLHERDNKQEADVKEAFAQIRQQYEILSAKLDKLIMRDFK